MTASLKSPCERSKRRWNWSAAGAMNWLSPRSLGVRVVAQTSGFEVCGTSPRGKFPGLGSHDGERSADPKNAGLRYTENARNEGTNRRSGLESVKAVVRSQELGVIRRTKAVFSSICAHLRNLWMALAESWKLTANR